MSSTTTFRDTDYAGLVPARGTLSAAANKLYPKGTIVQIDAAGRATPGADDNGFPAAGVAAATYDNRTGDEAGGLDDSIDIEVEYGVFGFDMDGTPLPGETVWVKDNQTVSDDSDSGQRGVAGVCVEVRGDQCYVWMGPGIADLFSDDSALGSDVTTLQSDVADLQTDALSAAAVINLPILAALVASTGVAVSAAAPATSVPGTAIADTKAAVVKWLAHATPGAIQLTVPVPADLDDTKDIVLKFHVSKSGATLGDATALTIGAYEIVPGAAHDADADFGVESDAVVGDAAAKTVTELTSTLLAANVHAYAESICFTIKPKNGTLGTDNFYMHSARLEYTRKLRTS